MRRRLRSRVKAASIAISIGAAAATGAVLLLRFWRTRSAPRTSLEKPESELPPPPPPDIRGPDIQRADDGVGPLRHRHYELSVANSTYSAPLLLIAVQEHLAELSPASLAEFSKSLGDANFMQPGDEYEITMLGPWNGRVRVAEVTSHTFTLVTCEGHPEAGYIVFRVFEDAHDPHMMQIEIESYARSRDATVELAYGTLGVGQQVQTEVWVTFLQRVAELAGMTTVPEVRIETAEFVD